MMAPIRSFMLCLWLALSLRRGFLPLCQGNPERSCASSNNFPVIIDVGMVHFNHYTRLGVSNFITHFSSSQEIAQSETFNLPLLNRRAERDS